MATDFIKTLPIPEILLISGRNPDANIGQYFIAPENDTLIFTADRFPPGLNINSKTGIINGNVIDVPIPTPFLVSVTATTEESQISSSEFFALTIMPADPNAVVSSEHTGGNPLYDVNKPMDAARLREWIEWLVREHFACAYFYNGAQPPVDFGGIPKVYQEAVSGLSVHVFQNFVILGMGETGFVEGNRGRFIKGLEGIYQNEIANSGWPAIGIIATDDHTLAKAWVVGRLLGMPVSEIPPNEISLVNFRNLSRLRGIDTSTHWPQQYPGS